jgi:transposase
VIKDRRKHSASFKAKVALEAVGEQKSISAIAQRYKIHANVVYKWKQELLGNSERIFDKNETNHQSSPQREADLLKKIGELTVERDFWNKGWDDSGKAEKRNGQTGQITAIDTAAMRIIASVAFELVLRTCGDERRTTQIGAAHRRVAS